jgi:N-acetylmuramoyl-L-alanine amidase
MRLRIVLALTAAAAFASPAGANADLLHTVAPGESLTSIASADHISITALAGANRLRADARLLAGAVLRIPPPGTGIHGRAGSPPPPTSHRYTVRLGDTLSGLAARDGVSISRLAALNHLRPNALLIAGGALRLPGAPPTSAPARPALGRYVIAAGDTLSGLAAREGVSVRRLAALNHLRVNGLLIAGAALRLPEARPTRAVVAPTLGSYVIAAGDTLSAIAARSGVSVSRLAALNHLRVNGVLIAGATLSVPASASSGPATPPSTVSYTLAPGDTLTSIASRAGISVPQLAEMNGISQDAVLLAGATLTVPATQGGPPYPTAERVTAAQVEQVAARGGVPSSLAAAVAWQESGFNNDLVSSADARGVMQILPGTWDWIQNTLTPQHPLAPASAIENVRGGVLFLHSLLLATQGDERLATAGYIQGLDSVRRNGMYAVTAQYVRDVMALQPQFGGP